MRKFFPHSRTAFTLVELLVVIAIIGILAGLILTATTKSQQTAKRIHCVSNMRQIGMALHMYIDDHRSLPGPCYYGVSEEYYKTTRDFKKFKGAKEVGPTELIGYVAQYLGLPAAPLLPKKAKGQIAVCPGFLSLAPHPQPRPEFEGYSYFLNNKYIVNWTNQAGKEVFTNIFGYMDGSRLVTAMPQKVEQLFHPESAWAMMDADKTSIQHGGPWMSPWRANLPSKPVHGSSTWNQMFFDGHVTSVTKLE